ncbi:hypothetical protein DRB96_05980 [Streptomyces sp. ICC1]|nr:hypothetical protein DRB89_14655 [Streptomyces sp. ICC4]AWZ11937.1 hypothetical protein DRB96_05980 [Streptomyces sp. ICC1]
MARPDKPIAPGSTAPEAKESDQAVVGGWQKYELFREEWGGLLPRVTLYDGKVFLVYANVQGTSLEARVYTPGEGWKEAGRLPKGYTRSAPAIASHNGHLHVFSVVGRSADEVLHAVMDPAGKWAMSTDKIQDEPGGYISSQRTYSDCVPAVAVHDGKLHLVTYRASGRKAILRVLDDKNQLLHVADVKLPVGPYRRLSLVSYGGKLHLIYTHKDRLIHLAYDGSAWQAQPDSPRTGTQQYGADSTVYDGKIHTAYNVADVQEIPTAQYFDQEVARLGLGYLVLPIEGSQDRFALTYEELVKAKATNPDVVYDVAENIRTADGTSETLLDILDGLEEGTAKDTVQVTTHRVGYQTYDGTAWSGEVMLPVHANQPPTVVAYKEPGDPDSGRLLLVYSGVESYIPPPPPPPQPVGALVSGSRVTHGRTDYGNGHYAKVNHSINAQLHRNPAGATHIKAWWHADVFKVSDWFGITTRDGGHVSGKIKLTRGSWLVTDHHFTAEIIDGQVMVEVTWEVEPGDYQVTIAKTHRTGGYYFPHSVDQPHYYSNVDMEHHSVSITAK